MEFPKRNRFESKKDVELDYDKRYVQRGGIQFRPDGFRYYCGSSWYDWLIDEGMDDKLEKYIHKINLKRGVLTDIRNPDKDKLLVIKNRKDSNIFTIKYGKYKKIGDNKWFLINWNKVSKDYGGIEICPYPKKIYYGKYESNEEWLATFISASGCIWNLKPILKDIELIYEKRNKRYIKV